MKTPFAELHRHLDVSIRPETMFEWIQKYDLDPQIQTLEGFKSNVLLKKPLSDLSSVLAKFQLFQRVFNDMDSLSRVAFECIEDCARDGTSLVELRYSPAFVSEFSKLKWIDILDGFEDGISKAIKKYPQMKAGLLLISSRDYGISEAEKTVNFYRTEIKKRAKTFLIGLDLAGNEVGFPSQMFAPAFKKAIQEEIPITIHAGEAAPASEIWDSIEYLGARRIGHGINCVQDPKLMEHLAKEEICLEVCPTSNYITQCTPTLEAHPLKQIVKAGIPACINTDDPGIFDVTLSSEFEVVRKKIGLNEAEIQWCMDSAMKHTFIN